MIQHQIEFKNEDETMAISKSLFSLARDYSYKLLFLFFTSVPLHEADVRTRLSIDPASLGSQRG